MRREQQACLMVQLLVGREQDFLWKREFASLVSVRGLDCEHDSWRSRGVVSARSLRSDLYCRRCNSGVTKETLCCDANSRRITPGFPNKCARVAFWPSASVNFST